MSGPLEGKVALVTGASRGIGKVIALELGKDGASVVVCARTERPSEDYPGSIYETAEAIRNAGGSAVPMRLDVTDDSAVRAAVDGIVAEHGRIDILVNNAGLLGGRGPFLGGDISQLDEFYRTNVRAPYLLSQLVGGKMAEAGGGAIINISSSLGRLPPVQQGGGGAHGGMGGGGSTVYGMTKAALDRFVAGVAAELREKSIAVINIYPGMTMTERFARMMPGLDSSRLERPETTAKVIAFLCRDPMPYAGQIIVAREFAERNQL